jgi:hypothetical protein
MSRFFPHRAARFLRGIRAFSEACIKKPAEHRCSAGSFFVTLETLFTWLPVLPVQAREPGPGPEPRLEPGLEPRPEPVSALRLSCTLRLQRITPQQKAGK